MMSALQTPGSGPQNSRARFVSERPIMEGAGVNLRYFGHIVCRFAALAGVFALGACATRTQIERRIDAMAPPPALQTPIRYVATFPGETEGCSATQKKTRAWNTHPVRAIQANFSRPAQNGQVDYFSVDIPAGQIMTVGNCASTDTNLIDAHFIDRS